MQKPLFLVKLCWWYRQRSPICFAEDLFCAFTDSLIFSPLWHDDIVPHLLLLLFAWLCFYSKRCICYEHRKHCKPLKICWCFTELSTWAIDILIFYLNISCWIFHDLLCNSLLQCIPALLWLMLVEGMFVHSHMVKNVSHGVKGHHSNCTLACCKVSIEREIQEIVFLSFSLECYYHTMIKKKKKKCKNGGRDYNLYIKAENENRGRQTRRLEKQEDKDRNGVEFGWHGQQMQHLLLHLVCVPCLLNSEKRLRLVMDGPVKMMVFLPEMFWQSCLATRLWSCGLFFKVARPSVPWPSFRWTEIWAVQGQKTRT